MRCRHLFLYPIVTLLAACQTQQTLSVEEAKKVTATFEGQAFKPPPKSIADITAILDQEAVADTSAIAAKVNLVNSTPPSTGSAADRAMYHLNRGRAAMDLGREGLALKDFRDAVKLVDRGANLPRDEVTNIRLWLSSAERLLGNVKNAEHQLLKRLETFRSGAVLRHLVRFYAITGNMTEAENRFRELGDRVDRYLASPRAQPNLATSFRFFRAQAEGIMEGAAGNWQKSESAFQESIETGKTHATNFGNNHFQLTTIDRQGLVKALIRQGRLLEAEVFVRDSLSQALREFGRNSAVTGREAALLAGVLDAQGRYKDAEKLLRAGLNIFQALKIPDGATSVARARFDLGRALVSQGHWSAAAREFDQTKNAFSTDAKVIYEQWELGGVDVPMALLLSGNVAEGQKLISRSYRRALSSFGPKHFATAEKQALLGVAFSLSGDKKGAVAAFRQALPILLSSSRQSDSAGSAAAGGVRLQVMIDAYIRLLSEIKDTPLERQLNFDAAAEAFRLADVVRSQSVQEALAASGARAAAGNAELAELVRQEQDARKRISAMFGLLATSLAVPTDQQNPAAVKDLRTRIDTLRQARASIAEVIEYRFPDYADLINPKPATVAKVQSSLRNGEALIATYVTGKHTYVWAVPKSGKAAFHVSALGEARIEAVVNELRKSLDPQASTLGDIPAFNVDLSHRLYRSLLDPVKAGWQDAKSLVVVAHRSLGQLPFSTFVVEPTRLPREAGALFSNYKAIPWLAKTHGVTVLPSVTSLASLRSLPAANPARRNFVGFGDPYFSVQQAADAASQGPTQVASLQSRGALNVRGLPVSLRSAPQTSGLSSADLAQLPRLPDTFDEVRSIAVALKADLTKDVFTGRQANETAVKAANLSGYKVITFATHGLVPGDLDGLREPALALSAPQVSGHPGDDGLLTLGEILSLKLDADWVVLSACNTGAADGAGAEAFSGLGRAFFYAGTRALLLSNWPVETTSARILTTDIFARQAGNPAITRSEAMRQAMVSLIDSDGFKDPDSGKIIFSYAHPIFWAPFSLVGDGGGGAKPAG